MLTVSWIYSHGVATDTRFLLGTLVFSGLLYLLCTYRIRVSERCEISALDIGLTASVAMLGPFWAALAALPCAVAVGRTDWLRTAYEGTRNTIQVYLAGMVFSAVSIPLLGADPEPIAPFVYATLAAGTMLVGVEYATHAFLLRIKYRQALEETWQQDLVPYLLSDALNEEVLRK